MNSSAKATLLQLAPGGRKNREKLNHRDLSLPMWKFASVDYYRTEVAAID